MIILIILMAAILRFYHLDTLPPALDWDEVSNAYNGYSILKTGLDEFGQFFPILFRAYDGYVPPVLIYLNSASVSIFGLNEFGARFPNALLGTLTIWGIYLLVAKTHPRGMQSRDQAHPGGELRLALLAALFLAISPWHIFYSRINVFPTTPIFFLIFGTYFFLLGLERFKYLILSLVFFILAIFSYFSAYIFVPLLVIFLAIIFRKKLSIKNSLILVLPLLVSSFLILFISPGGKNRFLGVSIFADPDLIKLSSQEAAVEGVLGKILHNRRLVYGQEFLKGYFANFHLDFLFSKGDAVQRTVVPGPGFGLLYLWDLPFLLGGLYYLIRIKPTGWSIYLAWLLLAPIAATVALPQPASTRITIMLPVLSIITAYGFWSLFKKSFLISRFLLILLVLNFVLFTHQYFYHFSYEKSADWFYGYRQLFDFLNQGENKDRKIHFIFKQHENLDQIHMFTLFYNQIDPATWQANGGTKLGCGGTTGQFVFDRYDFVPISCLTKPVDWESYNEGDLIVTSSPIDGSYLEKIEYLDGKDAFYVYEYEKVKGDLPKFMWLTASR